ncbi:hypothetical protein [Mesobacillus subterraneus]|uniref:hypothetical protein n=1 Tax=Mesobacillus subterraneus TaxID=285983 RepID=UPI0014766EFE|nr:hypothetical protein [Mesobacillus subterraneus]
MMVRIHNPVTGDKRKRGIDGQLHGGMLETADEFFDSIFQQKAKKQDESEPDEQK